MTVPSPTMQFDEYLPQVTQDLDRVTTHAAALPGKSDLAFHRTLDRKLAKELDEASERILALTRDLLDLVDRKKNSKRRRMDDEDDVVEGYKRGVVDSVDSLLEDADSCLDEITGRRKKAAIEVKPASIAAASVKLPGPWGSDKSTPPPIVSNAYSTASWKVAKPQSQFPDAVDNSYERPQWTPTLPVKHHAMVPVGHRNLLDYVINPDPAEAKAQLRRAKRHVKHPYYYEMKHIPYPTSMFTASKPVPVKPLEDTQPIWVDTPEKLAQMTEDLKKAKELAVDLEHHDAHSYYGFTCLMQISTREKDWLVDTLALRGELREDKLGGVLADPGVVKVFHGSDSDITWLQKDFDLYVVNLFDTYHATKVLRMTSHGLANLLLKYCNYITDKRYQLADWRIRPLTPEMQRYAQSDTHFLLYIYDHLRNALLEQSRPPSPDPESAGTNSPAPGPDTNPQRAMRQVLELSADTALNTYERDQYDRDPSTTTGPIRSGFKKFFGDTPLESEHGYIYRRLHAWRDETARKEDEGVAAILTNVMLATLTKLKNPTATAINNLTKSRWPTVGRESEAIQKIFHAAKDAWKAKIDSLNILAAQETGVDLASASTGVEIPEGTAPAKSVAVDSGPSATHENDAGEAVQIKWGLDQENTPTDNGVSSKLFGSTLRSTKSSTASSVKGKSSLFGDILPKTVKRKALANATEKPSFADVRKDIISDISPPAQVIVTSNDSEDAKKKPNELPAVEPVPFVPSALRTTNTAPSNTSSSSITKEIVETEDPELKPATSFDGNPETVLVKKSRKAKKREREALAVEASAPLSAENADNDHIVGNSAAETTAVDPSTSSEPSSKKQKKEKKKAKAKIEAKDIPVFDYSAEPNLLDNPNEATASRKKEKKNRKDKPKPVAITGTTFCKATQDKSQPKAGNMSKTFS